MAVYSRILNIAQATLALSVLSVVSDLCAQGSIDTALSALKPGQTVRLRVQGGDRTQSRVLSVRTESPTLWLEGASAPYEGAAIDSLWVRGRATAAGAIVGAVVLGGATFGVTSAICQSVNESPCGSETTVPLVLAGAAGRRAYRCRNRHCNSEMATALHTWPSCARRPAESAAR